MNKTDRLRRRLLVLGFADEFGPLYALYALLFDDHGLDTGQISTVFVLWAVVGIALEVPSGALADRCDRRVVVATGLALRGLGIAVWVMIPTYFGVIVGACLWALHNALTSGAWEAMIYDELAALGQAERYPSIMARVHQATHMGTMASAVAASGLTWAGLSLTALAWLTVAVHLVSIPLVVGLPRTSPQPFDRTEPSTSGFAAWRSTLRTGVITALRQPKVGKLVVLAAGLEGAFIFDEYVPLLARGREVDDALVPLFLVAVWVGLVVGDEIAARRPGLSPRTLGGTLMLGATAMVFALGTSSPVTLAAVGFTYLTMEVAWISTEARTQDLLPTQVRATATSVRALLGGLLNAAIFAFVGWTSSGSDPGPALLQATTVLFVVAVGTTLWLPTAGGHSSAPP